MAEVIRRPGLILAHLSTAPSANSPEPDLSPGRRENATQFVPLGAFCARRLST